MYFLIRKHASSSVASLLGLLLVLAMFTPIAASADASRVFQQTKNSIAIVLSISKNGIPTAQGTGVVIKSGLVATNWHVIESAESVKVSNGTREVKAKVLRASKAPDLALLRLDTAVLGLSPIALSDQIPGIGARVYAIGAPSGLEKTFSDGIVSGKRSFGDFSYVQTTADISPGSSGGALVDSNGHLIGITTFKVDADGGLNFAVPTKYVSALAASKYNVLPEPKSEPNKPLLITGKYILSTSKNGITLFNRADIAVSRNLVAFTEISRACGDHMCGIEFRSRDVLNCLSQSIATLKINVYNYHTGKHLNNDKGGRLANAEWKSWPDSSHEIYLRICGLAHQNSAAAKAIKHTHKNALKKLKCDLLSPDENFSSKLIIKNGHYGLKVSLTRLGSLCVR